MHLVVISPVVSITGDCPLDGFGTERCGTSGAFCPEGSVGRSLHLRGTDSKKKKPHRSNGHRVTDILHFSSQLLAILLAGGTEN